MIWAWRTCSPVKPGEGTGSAGHSNERGTSPPAVRFKGIAQHIPEIKASVCFDSDGKMRRSKPALKSVQ